jgi:hypothetical protein
MKSPTTSGDALRRYEVIEKAYCEGRWATVLEAGTVLLRELPDDGDQDVKGLRHRMHLLMAHTLLHGFGDRDAAEDLYLLVQNSDAESSLRQIAADGLDQCHKPLSSTFVAEDLEEEEEPSDARPKLFLPETENGEEEVSAVTPQQAKVAPVIELHPRETAPADTEPAAEVEMAPGAGPTRAPVSVPREETEGADLGLAVDPFQPSSGPPPPETIHITMPVMPWLAPREAEPRAQPPASSGSVDLLAPSTSQPLIPEVVEEPELLEVHQADPSLAEEVELEAAVEAPPLEELPGQANEPEEDDLEDLRSSLLQVKLG